MPQSSSSRRFVLRLVLFTLAGWLLWALGKDSAQPGLNNELAVSAASKTEPTRERAKEAGFSKRRLATTLAFTTLFFAGAAFSAGAGDLVVGAVEGSTDSAATSTEAAPEDPAASAPADDQSSADDSAPADPASGAAPDPAPNGDDQSGDSAGAPADGQPADGQSSGDQPADAGQPAGDGSDSAGSASDQPADGGDPAAGGASDGSGGQPDEPAAGPDSPAHAGDGQPSSSGGDAGPMSADQAPSDLEFDAASGYGVVWLHRNLGDPTPPAKRLSRTFAHRLDRVAREQHVDWAFLLGVLRAEGFHGRNPATVRQLETLASRLSSLHANADEWRAALALNGRTTFADRAQALARYNRAVGLRALVQGLQAQKRALEQRLLTDSRIDLYAGGRADVANDRVNVRVLALVLYLAEAHGQVTVSCLISGHRLYARPGVVSAHIYGLAVDIAGLEGQSILGHQQAGGLAERAVRNILLLPAELQPKQVISLLGLGGPSFPLADHYDHIHVGY
jgi:hypothetical protein